MAKRWIQSVDVQVDDVTGALLVCSGLEGAGKPDLLTWTTGQDAYANPTLGSVAHNGTVIFICVGSGGALVSIGDAAGAEKPYLIPANYWREIVIASGLGTSTRIVAKNLTLGVNNSNLLVEVR